ncbi:flagellar hook-basal body complex protein FliE [Alicyclobacillus macrosporangiidus]|uniref:Flagellar hook-basal body complex protein FliE n=1 Tax=Alicyclobacillus macrosporangiidus TaxID=392015 RepID=A0A1I7IQ79_9BACL|nr:flagellar hook-basal body complex protein FliE [Alicyclobacillus macrosporangiidus]SFU75079.1 flagellar hook-basal body complex protein FliE [Alicyclobacillus macrosporangiidus]
MLVNPVIGANAAGATGPSTGAADGNGDAGTGFAGALAKALDAANQTLTAADQTAASYAAGGPVTIDQLMIAEQQATLALDLVVQVRDRVVNAYQSVMNMQV